MNDFRFYCVRGYMKSGTNWIGGLLTTHESVSCRGEYHLERIAKATQETIEKYSIYSNPAMPELDVRLRTEMEKAYQRMLAATAAPGATVIGERTPCRIEPMSMPSAPQIVIVRDGRDVLVSRMFHLFNRPQTHRMFDRFPEMQATLAAFQADPWYFRDHPEELLKEKRFVLETARAWNDHVIADSETAARMSEHPIKFVRYEDLHADVEGQRKLLFEFLGVDPKRCGEIKGRLQPGFGQRDEAPQEFMRKGAIGDWQNYFNDQTRKWFKGVANEALVRFDYVTGMDW